jgi:RecA-family ATPase
VPLSLQEIARALNGRIYNGQVSCAGPGHSTDDNSVSVKLTADGEDIIVNTFSPADDRLAVLNWAREKIGIQLKRNSNGRADVDLAKMMQEAIASQTRESKFTITDTYPYQDRDGTLLYEVLRLEPKSFRQRQPDGRGGWIWKLGDRRVPYRWPELIKYPDATVIVTEGEKDADNVAALDLCASTVASGKWTDDCINALAGRHCWILQDIDPNGAGEAKALNAAKLLQPVAASVKIVKLPGLTGERHSKDVSDWLDVGHTKAELEDVCCATPDWEPNSTAETQTTETQPPTEPAGALKSGEPILSTPPKSPPLCFVKIEDWLDRDPPPRDWAVPDRFPLRNVSLLSGEGSIGKTIVLMQLAAAHVLGRGWLDTLPALGDAIYLNAEDEEGGLHRRFVDIAKFFDSPLADLKDHLHLLAMAGQDAVLGRATHSGLVKPTSLFNRLVEAAGDIKPKLIALDTSADIFAGAENDRSQVRQFIGLLRHLAIAGNSAVIVCAHPSLTGINSGTGLSGSTAWHNSVRARAYLRTVTVEGTEPDKTLRQLEFMKSNYGALADTVTVRWKDGVFVMDAKPGSLERMAADAKAEEIFLAMLKKIDSQGRTVSHKPTSPYYAPAVFAAETEAKAAKMSKKMLADAMQRLFEANKIKVENYGKPSRQSARIIACA